MGEATGSAGGAGGPNSPARTRAAPVGVLAALAALCAALLFAMGAVRYGSPPGSGWWAWVAAAGCLVAIGRRADRGWRGLRPPRLRALEWAVLVGVVALAAAVRLYGLGDIPAEIHGDSAECGNVAMDILGGRFAHVFAFSDWYRTPFLAFLPNAAAFWLGGPTVLALRLPSAIVGIAALVPLYFLARHWYGAAAAGWAIFLFALAHPAIHFSRIGLWNVQVMLLAVTAFCLTVAALDRRSGVLGALGGIVSGLALYSYTAGRIIPVILCALMPYYLLWHRRDARRLLPPIAIWGLAFFVTIAPLALNYVQDPVAFAEDRTGGVSVFAAEVLPHMQAVYGTESRWRILLGQTALTLRGLVTLGDASGQYGTTQPMFTPVTVAFLIAGLLIVLRHAARPHNLFVVSWLVLSLFLGSVLVIDPPSLTRWVATLPVLYLLAGVGVAGVVQWLRVRPRGARLAVGVGVVVAVQFAAWNLIGYWRYVQWAAERPGREWDVVKALEQNGPAYDYYLFTGPHMLPESPVMRLFFRNLRVVAALSAIDLPAGLAADTAFVVVPRYSDVGGALSERFPGIERIPVRSNGVTQVIVYRCSTANGCRRSW